MVAGVLGFELRHVMQKTQANYLPLKQVQDWKHSNILETLYNDENTKNLKTSLTKAYTSKLKY